MPRVVVAGCVLGLFAALFGAVIFQSQAFFYRDAAHFYYPLFQLVQDEWNAGRVPLWNPYENSGQPLLGNPTASVLYPLKAVFFLPVPYPVAYKAYILLHVLLCGAWAYGMARYWGSSVEAAGVCSLSYAFGATVLFQYANVVFLCGAAWAPATLMMADMAIRHRQWWGAIGLGTALALQVLAGDPEVAYLCGVSGALYAALLRRGGTRPDVRSGAVSATSVEPRNAAAQVVSPRPHRLRMLALAAGMVGVLSAVQVLPSWEFSRRSLRAFSEVPRSLYELAYRVVTQPEQIFTKAFRPPGSAEEPPPALAGLVGAGAAAPHNIYDFSLEPWRLVEFLWPNISGRQFPINARWIAAIGEGEKIWTPSLYMGVVPMVLAMGVAFGGCRTAWQRWLRLLVVIGVVGSFGRFGLVWVLRAIFGEQFGVLPGSAGAVGNEVGGIYWLMVVVLPGFVSFRYPSKLLVLGALGLSGLAAVGWDRAWGEGGRGIRRALLVVGLVSMVLAVLGWGYRGTLQAWWQSPEVQRRTLDSYYGRLDVERAWWSLEGSLMHSALVATVALGLLAWGLSTGGGAGGVHSLRARLQALGGRFAPAGLLVLIALDLGLANRWLIVTGPQADLESTPKALELIQAFDAQHPEPEPYRIYRTLFFHPPGWLQESSSARNREGLRWERDMLLPKYGLHYSVPYVLSSDTMSLYDYEFFLAPWYERRPDGQQWVYYPQIGFDCWNTKYFILPRMLVDHLEHRGFRSFLFDLKGNPAPVLYPTRPEEEEEAERLDFQIVLNPDAFPRAWIVHRLSLINPISGPGKHRRRQIIESLLREGNPDLRTTALVEVSDPELVERFHVSAADSAGERCRITRYEPQRVELRAKLNAPGMLVLADTYYPGWNVDVDGRPATIFRANRMMRGVGLDAGEHRVVFRYEPRSFWWGARISSAGWLSVLLAGIVTAFRKLRPLSAMSR